MEFYKKASSNTPTEMVEKKDSLEVNIKSGKKIRACISQAIKTLQTSKDKVVICGSGPTVTKAITTAEIVKRKFKGLHQQNNLYYTKTEDLWDAKEEGLDQLKVTRNVPSISIMLSFNQLVDEQAPGYQGPGVHQPLVQFRDEDIELADERFEGKNELQQSQGQHKQTDKRKAGIKRDRKQSKNKQQQSKKEKTVSEKDNTTQNEETSTATNKDFKKRHEGLKPSKRQHSEKDKT